MITTAAEKPTDLGAIFSCRGLIPLIGKSLTPIHMKLIRSSSKLLHESITAKEMDHNMNETHARYARAVQLPSGAFRLRSRFGTHTMDVTSPRIMTTIFPYLVHFGHGTAMLHMRLNGVAYIARPWAGVNVTNNTPLWPPNQNFMPLSESNPLFRPGSNILQVFAGGAWISRVNHDVAIFETTASCTTVHLTLHQKHVAANLGQRKLQLVCTPFGV